MRLTQMDDYITGKVESVMKENKRLDFLKSIRVPSEEDDDGRRGQETHGNPVHEMTRQEEYDLQKELERRFEELFGTTPED